MAEDFLEENIFRNFIIRDGKEAENTRYLCVQVTEVVKALKGPFEFIRLNSLLKALLFSS